MSNFKVNQTLNHNGKTFTRGEVIKDMAEHDIKAFTEAGFGSEVKEDKAKQEAPENKGKSPPTKS